MWDSGMWDSGVCVGQRRVWDSSVCGTAACVGQWRVWDSGVWDSGMWDSGVASKPAHLSWKGALQQGEVTRTTRCLPRRDQSMGLPGIPSDRQAGPRRAIACMLPGRGWGPTSYIGPQGHLVVVDNPSRSRAPEVGPKAVVHLRGAESALEARTSFTGDNQNITQPPPRGTHPTPYDRRTQAHDAVCRPNLTCWMVGSPARLVRRLRMLRSDICRRAATGGMRDNMEGRRVTSAFMSLSSSSSWFRTAGREGLRWRACPALHGCHTAVPRKVPLTYITTHTQK